MTPNIDVRHSPIAGTWYSGDPVVLGRQIDSFLAQATLPELNGEIIGLMAPHAGYRYSGRTAGYAFRCVQGQSRTLVAVISPFHNYHPAPFLTTAHSAYATPLGEIPLDRAALGQLDAALKELDTPGLTPVAHDEEHSLEIELPFLQRALAGPFTLLPVMLRNQSTASAQKLGQALAEVLRDKPALLVASTDLSHFYSESTAGELDAEMLRQVGAFSPEGVIQAEQDGTGHACGFAAVAGVLWAARRLGANAVEILHHSTSAEETHDRSSVVGYGAAAILKRP